MKKLFKGSFILCMFMGLIILSSCLKSVEEDNDQDSLLMHLSGEALIDDNLIHWHGRQHHDEVNNRVYFYHTASGFTVTFQGTELKAKFYATNTNNPNRRPYFTIMLDGKEAEKGDLIYFENETEDIYLAKDLSDTTHTLTFLKRSEAQDALTSLISLSTDGYFKSPNTYYDMNLLFLGGSGISGNGVFGSPFESRNTENSSSLHAFGYKTAEQLNADFQFVAGSGWGLKWGFNETNQNGLINIRTAFDKIGIDDTKNLIPIDYNHQSFIPDVIVINLGGNDYNAHIKHLSNEAQKEAEEIFQAAVIELLNHLNTLYPNAYIYWTHTGSINGGLASVVMSDLDPLRTFVEPLIIYSPGSFGDSKGANNHAGETTHERNAALLVTAIKQQFEED